MADFYLKVSDIEKSYQSRLLFSSFSYTFVPGNIYCFRGLSGCGKTTMLEILSGYLKPDKGSVVFFSKRRLKEEVSYFSTDNEIFQELTAFENLLLVSSDEKRVRDVLKSLDLENQKDIKGIDLSKGETARLAIGRLMLSNKKILVLDEPVGNLDRKNAEMIFKVLNEIKKDQIIILSSNDDMGMESYCDVVFEHNGQSFLLKSSKEKQNTPFLKDEKRQPIRFLCTFLKSLLYRTWKQKALLIPLLIFSELVFCVSFMFVQSYGNEYLYQSMKQSGIQGVVLQEGVESDYHSANGFRMMIENQECFAIFNEQNEFDTSYCKMKVSSSCGLSIPSDLAEKLKLSVGSTVKINDSDTDFIVDEIYSYHSSESQTSSLMEKYDEVKKEDIMLYSNPILVSHDMAFELVDMDTPIYSYGSDLLFKENKTEFYPPFFLEGLDRNTYQFWKQKEEYNHIVRIIGYVSLSLFVFLSLLLVSSVSFGFNKEMILFHYIDGNNRRGLLITAIDVVVCLVSSLLLSSGLSALLQSVMNLSIVRFYEIQNYIPVLQNAGLSILFLFLSTIIVMLLSFFFIWFVYQIAFMRQTKRKD